MSLPVSQYEALLAEVRGLRRKAQRVQQLATPLLSNCGSSDVNSTLPRRGEEQNDQVRFPRTGVKMESLLTGRLPNGSNGGGSSADGDTTCSEDECGASSTTHMSISSEPTIAHHGQISTLYHGTWPVERTMWASEPNSNRATTTTSNHLEVTSVMSFASSSGGALLASPSMSRRCSQQLEAKVDMVYSLLAMLSGQEHADMGETLLALSTSPESCAAMRQSGCIPLLVQMVQSDREAEARRKAAQALHNLVHAQSDEKLKKREVRVLKLLEHAREYTEELRGCGDREPDGTSSTVEDDDKHPVQTVAHLMKLSFDELHRQAICTLGGIHTIAGLVETEHANHGSTIDEQHCVLMRRYACMALTNLTFGDSGNKALLCSFREFMRALVVQLQSPSDELRQVTASVLRNLSWRADSSSKEILREVGSVTGLMKAAMLDNKENTLKSVLSALWNLSAHCTENKSEICSVDGALGFLVDMLTYKTPSKSLAIIENSGGILRNISSQIAVRDDYREVLRRHNCLEILLDQLKSPSLTIVSNACGTLWNLSAKCPTDQEALWQLGAPAMLRSLNHSKHKMIAMGSSAALKNLLSAKPSQPLLPTMDSTALAMDLPVLPTLGARKQKAMLQDLDHTLAETYENIEKDSPVKAAKDTNKYSDYETDFSSLTLEEPSTSHDTKKRFLKKSDDKGFSVGADSGLQSLDIDSGSSSSLDNDKKCGRAKSKEVSVCSDEKDRCSIEDVSDSDIQSSFEQRLQEDSSLLLSGLGMRRDITTTTSLMTSLSKSFRSPNVTMFEGDIDEIGVDDISIQFASSQDVEDGAEKADAETEKRLQRQANKTSGIPLPRSLPRPIPVSAQPELRKSVLPRRSLQTSTPIKLNGNARRSEGSSEASKALTPDECSLPPLDSKSSDDDSKSSVDDDCSYLSHEARASERDRLLERSCEEINPVDNRMLDPDAMIESLERFTAELVSQASHLQSNKDNTWNEDTAPTEVTFPSISGSAPNVITFGSSESSEMPNGDVDKPQEPKSSDFSSISTMTASTLIEIEAKKMATVFKNQAEMSNSITSIASLDLDKVQPPSLLESVFSDPSRSPKPAPPRRKSLPKGLMVRRALSNSLHNGSSLDSLSNLDQVCPPSALGEVLDLDGSITSVASLPSESADVKADFLINGTTNRSFHNSIFANCSHVSDLDNINPPSLFNEITDLCNSLADVPTEAIASETEVFEDCRTHLVPTTEDDVTEFSDANSVTPIQSDLSSAETSPKRNKTIATTMTSKQRRNLARERYKTYTVAAELVMKEEEERQSTSEEFKTADCASRMTAKQRRESDRSRFETRVVEEAVIDLSQQPVIPAQSPRTKLSIRRNFLQKRMENRDRFKTQVLTPEANDNDLHLMVQREADLVLRSLNETKTTAGDDLLECETLSLVSNEDDSEHNSINYRTYHKSWSLNKNIPVIQDEKPPKPKIVKPTGKVQVHEVEDAAPEPKSIRGRRKPLYAKTSKLKPIKSVTSNLVKNVTSSIKSVKLVTKPPINRASTSVKPKPLERQGTFTKDDAPKSRIPTPGAFAKPRSASSTSSVKTTYMRSTSADSSNRRIAPSSTTKRASIPAPGQRSASNSSLNGQSTKKQVTSKIASLWKKIEETKTKQPAKKDTRVWIQGQGGAGSREKTKGKDDGKRVSRLGSFIAVEGAEGGAAN